MIKKINITAPANSVEDVIEYEKAGITEIYLGFMDSNKTYKNSINKRFKTSANFNNFDELKKVRNIFSGKISFTLNAPFFDVSQLNELKSQIETTKNFVDNYIIADISIINLVKKIAPKKEIVISCIASCLNSETVQFYKSLGIKKIILPRHLTIEEIKIIVNNHPDINFEVMILNQFCRNIDGFCSRCHITRQKGKKEETITNCNIPFKYNILNLNNNPISDLAKINLGSYLKFNPWCGLCFIKELEKIGVTNLKIVGRGNNLKKKVLDIKLVQKVINKTKLTDKEFQNFCKQNFKETFNKSCNHNCYY